MENDGGGWIARDLKRERKGEVKNLTALMGNKEKQESVEARGDSEQRRKGEVESDEVGELARE